MLSLKNELENLLEIIENKVDTLRFADTIADLEDDLEFKAMRIKLILDGELSWRQEMYYNLEDFDADVVKYIRRAK